MGAPLLRRLERRNVVHTAGLQGSQRRTEPRRAGVGSGALFIGNFWTARAVLLFSTFIKRLIINKQKKNTKTASYISHLVNFTKQPRESLFRAWAFLERVAGLGFGFAAVVLRGRPRFLLAGVGGAGCSIISTRCSINSTQALTSRF